MIKVFNSTDTTFSTNGNVVLEPTYANVHKEDNGEYYLDIETNLQDEVIKHIDSVAGTTIDTTGTTLTSVDTTKENEFTYLKGDTTQESSPTPSDPKQIHVVSGDNTINIGGKNFYNIEGDFSVSNITITGTSEYLLITGGSPSTESKVDIGIAKLLAGTYTITNEFLEGNEYIGGWVYYKGTWTRPTSTSLGVSSTNPKAVVTFTLSEPKDVCFGLYYSNTRNYQNCKIRLQIEKGSVSTSFTPYRPLNSQLISLGMKNLIPTNTSDWEQGTLSTSGETPSTTRIRTINYYPISNNTDYCVKVEDINYCFLNIYLYDANKTYIEQVYDIDHSFNGATSFHFNLSTSFAPNVSYMRVVLRNSNNSATITASEIETIKPQMTIGTIPSIISDNPIELCKIGTYQDYIYKNNGVWYLHKEIDKVVVNGTEAGIYQSGSLTNTMRMAIPSGLVLSTTTTNMLCDKLPVVSGYNTDNEHIYMSNNNFYAFVNKSRGVSNLATFKTWLSTNNLTCYAVLKEATETEITGTLKDQLEALDKLRLFEGTTNIMITPNDLSPTLTVHYNYVTGGDVTTGDYLQPNNLLVCNTPTGNQAFRITNVEKTRHKIKIKANHVFYDSMNYVINDSYVVDKNLNDALDHLNNATDNTSPFTTTSNVNTINSFRCVRKSLYEAINVLLERWGGHLVRDNFDIKIMNSIGQDNGVTVRYAKNLKDITVDYNWDNVVTKILPVGYDGVTLDEIYLYSDTQYDIPYTKVVHFDQDIDIDQFRDGDGNVDEDAYTNALKADLRNQASTYLLENAIPKVNYELQANLEKITDVGDIIEVIDERLGINIMTSLIAFDYDPILNKYTYIQFGNFQKKLNDLTSYIETQSSEVANEISTATKVTLQTELNQATSQLWGVLGNSYVIVEGDKILIVDTLPKENATNVIMLNSGGIGFSNTGINGTFTSAWTIDNKLNMENINVINLTADLIKGGTLKLGSNINQNGILEVYDEANNLIAQLNKDGLRMNATDGGYILINTTVGFSGYDRNDNRIYWVDGDEFHMKKSVVEEEITLVDKMRIIPITITDGNNNIVNDGIGWVSTL